MDGVDEEGGLGVIGTVWEFMDAKWVFLGLYGLFVKAV